MPKVRLVVLHKFCSKFHTLSPVHKFWKLIKIWQSYREFNGGNLLLRHSVDADNRYEGNGLKKCEFWGGSEKQQASKLMWRQVADCSRGGFQPPETHDRRLWTAECVGSLAARKTTTGDGGGWNRRRTQLLTDAITYHMTHLCHRITMMCGTVHQLHFTNPNVT